MSDNILLTIEDVDFVRATLAAVHVYLHAQDMADSQRALRAEVKPSGLTREVAACLEQVEESVAAFLLAERDRVRFSLPEEEEDDFADEDYEDEPDDAA